jgi:drug/metabolite transporter (DMT)-like permease
VKSEITPPGDSAVTAVANGGGQAESAHSTGTILTVLLFQQLLGAISFAITKYGVGIIEPFTFAFYRFIIAAALLLAITRIRKYEKPIARADYWKIIGLGAIIIPFNQVTYLFGQSLTGAGHAALLFATTPIWIFILATIYLKEKLVTRRIVGIIVAVAGVAIIMFGGAVKIGKEYLIGDLIIWFSVLAWATYTVLGKPLVRKYGAFRVTAYALSSGTCLYLPFGFYQASKLDYTSTTAGAWLAVLYMAIAVSIVAYVMWYWVLKHIEATRMAVFHNIQPVIASAMAYVWLGEPLGWTFIIGGVIVLAGVIVAEIR